MFFPFVLGFSDVLRKFPVLTGLFLKSKGYGNQLSFFFPSPYIKASIVPKSEFFLFFSKKAKKP